MISIDKLADTVANMLTEYENKIQEEVNKAGKNTAKATQKELKKTSPQHTGKYAKSWRIKEETYFSQPNKYTVYSKKYMLNHLLEHGYVHYKTGKRTKAYPHIAKAEKNAIDMYIKLVKEGIENANK